MLLGDTSETPDPFTGAGLRATLECPYPTFYRVLPQPV